jgi:hypothetical protein
VKNPDESLAKVLGGMCEKNWVSRPPPLVQGAAAELVREASATVELSHAR